jgi:hypothetical protein
MASRIRPSRQERAAWPAGRQAGIYPVLRPILTKMDEDELGFECYRLWQPSRLVA